MEISLRTILCAVDFSRFTAPMVRFAANFANRFDAHLKVFHSVYIPQDALHRTAFFERSGEQARRAAEAQRRIHELMAGRACDWSSIVVCGEPVSAIVETAESAEADLVITAGHTMSGIKRMLLGKIVERLPRELKKPHIVVRPDKKRYGEKVFGGIRRVMICCDAAVENRFLIEYGLGIAKRFAARVQIVHAIESPAEAVLLAPVNGPYSVMQNELDQKMIERIESMAASCIGAEKPFSVHLVHGHPGDELCRFAEKNEADLIVVGARHHSRFEIMLIGSTTEQLIRSAPCSVLIVPEGRG